MNVRIKVPNIDLVNIVDDCISNVRTEDRKHRISNYKDMLINNRDTYILAMSSGSEFAEESFDFDLATIKSDMEWVYTNKFSKKGQPGRRHYDRILASSPNNRCPYCLHGEVRQIDHYMAKSNYPTLAITTENLVPTCSDCNFEKNDSNVLLPHPYYDDIDSTFFLKCSVNILNEELVFEYYIEKSEEMSAMLFEKIANLFENSRLLTLFGNHASAEFNLQKRTLVRATTRGNEGLNEILEDNFQGAVEALGRNSWQASLYKGMLEETSLIYPLLYSQKDKYGME